MDDGHARVKMDEVRKHLDNTWFAWIGGSESSSVFYYRIHSPVILIEFDHQRPANLAPVRHRSASSPTGSTSTWSCAPRTATTTARICCASTTSCTRTRNPGAKGDGEEVAPVRQVQSFRVQNCMTRRQLLRTLSAQAAALGALRDRASAAAGPNIKWAVSMFLWTSTQWPDRCSLR